MKYKLVEVPLPWLIQLLVMAMRYALPRTISTGAPDEEVMQYWMHFLPLIEDEWLRQTLVDIELQHRFWLMHPKTDASRRPEDEAEDRRQKFKKKLEAELAQRAKKAARAKKI